MQAGIGGILTALEHRHAQYVIGAIVFTSRAPAPDGRKDPTWMRWGTMLALHGDLPDDTWAQWMTAGHYKDVESSSILDFIFPAWISLPALEEQTAWRIMEEAKRRLDAERRTHDVLEERALAKAAGKISNGFRGRQIMRRALEDFKTAQAERWLEFNGELFWRCATGVLGEFRCDQRCKYCGGTGVMPYVLDEKRQQVKCAGCYGTGVTRRSDRERAREMGVPWSSYKRAWRAPYDWLYQEALTARRQAVRHLREQLDE